MPTHYAGDEAGDVSFAFAKGASRFFIIALICTREPERLREALSAFKAAHHLRDAFEFSFHGLTNLRLKASVLTALNAFPFSVWAVIVDKRALSAPFRMMDRTHFYLFFVTELLRFIPESERAQSVLMLDEFDRSGRQPVELGKALKILDIHKGFKKITTKRSRSEPLIQIADLMAGCVFSKFARNEDRFFKIVRSKFARVIEYAE